MYIRSGACWRRRSGRHAARRLRRRCCRRLDSQWVRRPADAACAVAPPHATCPHDGRRGCASLGGGGRCGRRVGLVLLVLLLGYPALPEDPADKGGEAAPADDRHGRHALVVYAHEADDEDGHGADVLEDDGGVGDERPKVVRLQAGVALEVFEKRCLVGVVVWDCPCVSRFCFSGLCLMGRRVEREVLHVMRNVQDCFTHMSFFQARFRRRLRLLSE